MKFKHRVLISILTILLIAGLCGCGVDMSTAAGNVSQVTNAKENMTEDSEPAESAEAFLASIPEYSGDPFCYVNDNEPDFEEDEIWIATQESLDPLDE